MRAWRRFWVAMAWLAGLSLCVLIGLVVLAPEGPRTASPGQARQAWPGVTLPRLWGVAVGGPKPESGSAACAAPDFDQAALANAADLTTLTWAPFHRSEIGWETYAPRIAHEIGSACAPTTAGFAAALARWQGAHGLAENGQLDPASFNAMNIGWERARPFVRISESGVCPDAPSDAGLVWASPEEGYERKPNQLRAGALAAYRRMVAAARVSLTAVAGDHRLLSIFSGYRSPQEDAARCARDNDCGNVTRALCSAHRTGLAMDLNLGAAPGHAPESSDDANRLYQSKSAAYLWLVANASRYGFVNYPFEPWHWEWTGETP